VNGIEFGVSAVDVALLIFCFNINLTFRGSASEYTLLFVSCNNESI
jgi:hypothetical protein